MKSLGAIGWELTWKVEETLEDGLPEGKVSGE